MTHSPSSTRSGQRRDPGRGAPPYRAGARVFALVALAMLGLCLGLAGHTLGFSRPHGKLFQIFIGLPLAVAAAPLVWRGFVSRNWACLCVACAAIAAFGHQHLLDFREFPERYATRLHAVLEGQALQTIMKDLDELSSRIDRIAKSGQGLSDDQRQQIVAAQSVRDSSAEEIRDMKASADQFAGEAADPELAPLLAMRRDEWRRIREKYERGGVQQLGLGQLPGSVDDVRQSSLPELRVLRTFGFREYLAVKTAQGARFRWFGKDVRFGPTATIAWWLAEIALAATIACLLVRRVDKSKDLKQALGGVRP